MSQRTRDFFADLLVVYCGVSLFTWFVLAVIDYYVKCCGG